MAALSTIALLSLSAAASASKYVEQRKAAKQVEQQGDYEAMLFGRNATLATQQADDTIARGEEAVGGVVRDARQVHGGQRVAFAAQGIDINSGSAADVQANDSALATVDMQRIRTNAAREAAGYRTEADTYRMQGDWARSSARNQARAMRRQSIGTLLEGAGALASIWAGAPKGIGGASPVPNATANVAMPSGLPQYGPNQYMKRYTRNANY